MRTFLSITAPFLAAVTLTLACSPSAPATSDATSVPRATTTAKQATGKPVPTSLTRDVCRPPYATGTPTAESVFCADPSAMSRAELVDIIDGDTLDALVGGTEERIRVFGIDTPERGEPCYAEASAALAILAGTDVRLVADARDRDRNGRLLRYVYTPEGLSIDAVLIRAGLALAWTRDGTLRDALVELEARARDAHQGCLWG